jgi:hypothetical protein
MITLSICQTGTVDVARSQHETKADAHHALARFARGYDIQGYGTDSGTLTTKCGWVNQAAYTWNIR